MEGPENSPSVRVARRAMAKASAVDTGITSSSRRRRAGRDGTRRRHPRCGGSRATRPRARPTRRAPRRPGEGRVVPAECLAHAQEAPGRADVEAERVDGARDLRRDLLPQLRTRRPVGVGELVGLVGVERRPAPWRAAHAGYEVRRDPGGACDDLDVGTEGFHRAALLVGEGVGGDDAERVARDGADERQRAAGAPARVLDHGLAGRGAGRSARPPRSWPVPCGPCRSRWGWRPPASPRPRPCRARRGT